MQDGLKRKINSNKYQRKLFKLVSIVEQFNKISTILHKSTQMNTIFKIKMIK